jgi:hypothetical protein
MGTKEDRQALRDSIPVESIVVDEDLATNTDPAAQVEPEKAPVKLVADTEVEEVENESTDENTEVEETEVEEVAVKGISQETFNRRVGKEVAKTKALEKQNAELMERLQKLESKEEDRPLTQAEVNQKIQIESERLANQKAQQIAFDNACNNLVAASEKENPGIMERLLELKDNIDDLPRPMIDALLNIENGHSVLNYLTQNLDEAEKFYKMNPVKQALELGKLSAKIVAKKNKPMTKAPPPVNPINGGGKAIINSMPTDNDSDEAWFEKRAKTRREQRYL